MWEQFWTLSPQLLITFFGVFLAFGLDRIIDWVNDFRKKEDLLNDLHNELEEIESKIFPQTTAVYLLFPDIWDSAISSGQIRLLNSEQLKKLASVYRFIKGTQYEAEWVRRAMEDFNVVPKNEKEKREWLEGRSNWLRSRHEKRGKELSEKIEQILKEKWWDC